jgi:hypothetical protein
MPLALKRRAQAFDNPDWIFDLKYDGFRALLEINGSEARPATASNISIRLLWRWRGASASLTPSSTAK